MNKANEIIFIGLIDDRYYVMIYQEAIIKKYPVSVFDLPYVERLINRQFPSYKLLPLFTDSKYDELISFESEDNAIDMAREVVALMHQGTDQFKDMLKVKQVKQQKQKVMSKSNFYKPAEAKLLAKISADFSIKSVLGTMHATFAIGERVCKVAKEQTANVEGAIRHKIGAVQGTRQEIAKRRNDYTEKKLNQVAELPKRIALPNWVKKGVRDSKEPQLKTA